MEKECPLYLQRDFVTRISRVTFGDRDFVINTTKDKRKNNSGSYRYYYELFDNNTLVSSCHVSVLNHSMDFREDYLAKSMKIKPSSCLEIISFASEAIEDVPGLGKRVVEHKGKGYGSFLLNFVIGDLVEYSNYFDKLVPIIFDRMDTPEAIAFYNNFGAVTNITTKADKIVTPMIIECPEQIKKYTGTIISEEYLDSTSGHQLQ